MAYLLGCSVNAFSSNSPFNNLYRWYQFTNIHTFSSASEFKTHSNMEWETLHTKIEYPCLMLCDVAGWCMPVECVYTQLPCSNQLQLKSFRSLLNNYPVNSVKQEFWMDKWKTSFITKHWLIHFNDFKSFWVKVKNIYNFPSVLVAFKNQ